MNYIEENEKLIEMIKRMDPYEINIVKDCSCGAEMENYSTCVFCGNNFDDPHYENCKYIVVTKKG